MYNAINKIAAEPILELIDSNYSNYEQYYTPPKTLIAALSPAAFSPAAFSLVASLPSKLRRPSPRLLKRPSAVVL